MLEDLGIDEDARVADRLAVLFLGFLQVDDEDLLGHADLDRGEADSRRRVHRLEHVRDERADAIVDLSDGRGDLPQARIGDFDDGQYGHRENLSPPSPPRKGGESKGWVACEWAHEYVSSAALSRFRGTHPPASPLGEGRTRRSAFSPSAPERACPRRDSRLASDGKSMRQLTDANGKSFQTLGEVMRRRLALQSLVFIASTTSSIPPLATRLTSVSIVRSSGRTPSSADSRPPST